jgi:hypothetical protein
MGIEKPLIFSSFSPQGILNLPVLGCASYLLYGQDLFFLMVYNGRMFCYFHVIHLHMF